MSADDFRNAACTGKKTYSFVRARRLAREVSQRHDEPLQPYHCTFCHGWHIGRPGGKGRKPKRDQDRELDLR